MISDGRMSEQGCCDEYDSPRHCRGCYCQERIESLLTKNTRNCVALSHPFQNAPDFPCVTCFIRRHFLQLHLQFHFSELVRPFGMHFIVFNVGHLHPQVKFEHFL